MVAQDLTAEEYEKLGRYFRTSSSAKSAK